MNGPVVDNSHAIRDEWPIFFAQLARAINTGAGQFVDDLICVPELFARSLICERLINCRKLVPLLQ